MNVAVTDATTTFLTPADEADLPKALVSGDLDPETGLTAGMAALITRVREQAWLAGTDVSDDAGRSRIRSAAAKIARSKTAIDKARKDLTADYRAKTAAINDVGNAATAEMQKLQDAVRRPLTEWETAEKARIAALEARLAAMVPPPTLVTMTAAEIAERIREIEAVDPGDGTWGEMVDIAAHRRSETLTALRAAFRAVKKREDDAAELARLRAAEAERQAKEAAAEEARRAEAARAEDERRAKEAEEQRQRDLADAEERAARAAQEKAEREAEQKIAAAKRDAEEAERRLAEAAEAAERERQAAAEREAAAAKAAEEAKARAVEAERERAAGQRRQEEAARQRREQNARVRAKARAAMVDALAAVTTHPGQSHAEAVADAIMAGGIPHCEFRP